MKQVLFYYPQHFNRSSRGTNPFFDSLIGICREEGISHDVMEEPDAATDKPRNPAARKADTFYWSVTILRKALSLLLPRRDFYARERMAGRIFNALTFGRFRYRTYVTISGSMFHFFAALNPNARVYDMQHGVLCKHHQTFFDERQLRLRPQFYNPQLHFMFWGEGYRDCFCRGEESVMRGRDHVTGYPVEMEIEGSPADHSASRLVVVSLQFTHSVDMAEREKMKRTLWRFLEEMEPAGLEIVLKNHPRYNNSIPLDDLFLRFPGIKLTNEPLDSLGRRARLHVTYFSTTAFEFAAFGVPTYFLNNQDQRRDDLMYYDEYRYPLYRGLTAPQVAARLADSAAYLADSRTVLEWYRAFYSPFDRRKFMNLISPER